MTSVFFNNFNHYGQQNLIEDLSIEAISIYGHEIFYCPRTIEAKDDIYGEDSVSSYNQAIQTDVYIKSFDSYEGDGTFLSKFNLEVRDQITFAVAIRTFSREVASVASIDRPQEGDLIYSPIMNRIFVVKYVVKEAVFYQMGALQFHELVCEVWEYSSERLNTGIEYIDSLEDKYSVDLYNAATILDNNGNSILTNLNEPIVLSQFDFDEQNLDVMADNDEFIFEKDRDNILDWSQIDPFSEDDLI